MIEQLHAQIAAVAPIVGVSIGRKEDKLTWRIDFAPEATQPHRDAAAGVVASFDVEAVEAAEASEQEANDTLALAAHTDAVFQALKTATAAQISTHVNNTFPLMLPAQRNVLKLLLVVAAAALRRGVI